MVALLASTSKRVQQGLRSGFARSIAILAGGTLTAQVLNVAVSPILTRIYLPEETGQLGLFLSFIGFASVVLSLKYETAIVAAREVRQAALLTLLSMVLVVPTSLIAGGILAVLTSKSLLGFGDLPRSAIIMMYPSLLLVGLYMALRYWLVRSEDYGLISQVSVVQSGVRSLFQVGLGLVVPGEIGLPLGDTVSRAFGLERMLRVASKSLREAIGRLKVMDILRVAMEYRKFPLITLPSTVTDVLALNLPLPLVAHYFGFEAAGQFMLVQRVITLPMTLIGTSVADVVHGRLAELLDISRGQAKNLFLRTSGALLLIGLFPTGVLLLFGPALFSWVFGREWAAAGTMAQIMAPWALAQFIVSPVSRVCFVYDGQATKLIYDMVALLSVVLVMVAANRYDLSLPNALAWLSGIRALSYVLYFGLLLRLVMRGNKT